MNNQIGKITSMNFGWDGVPFLYFNIDFDGGGVSILIPIDRDMHERINTLRDTVITDTHKGIIGSYVVVAFHGSSFGAPLWIENIVDHTKRWFTRSDEYEYAVWMDMLKRRKQ
jgi:hypothetical protein